MLKDFKVLKYSTVSTRMVLVVGACFCLPVVAQEREGLHPFVRYSATYESNFLHAQDGVTIPVSGVAGAPRVRSDTIQRLEGGVNFEKKVSQQYFLANLSGSYNWFDNFKALDHSGTDALLRWNWHLGKQWEGNIGTSYARAFSSFLDFQPAGSLELLRNMRTQRRDFFDAAWKFHPSWRVRAGVTRDDVEYDLFAQQTGNRTDDAAEIGFDYVSTTGSSIGAQYRRIEGDYPNRGAFNSDYTQNELMAKIYWHATVKSQLQFLAGQVERKHNIVDSTWPSSQDFSGWNAKAIATWQPTSKVGMNLSVWREIGAYDNLVVGTGGLNTYTLNRGISLAPYWSITSKVRVDSMLRYEKREFKGLLVGNSERVDTPRYVSVSLQYLPRPTIQMGASVFHDERTSNQPTGGYRSQGVMFHSRFQF